MIVDSHTHVFPPDICRTPERLFAREPYFARLYGHPKAKLATADELIAALDRNGIAAAVALNFGWSDPGLCAATNDYLADAARRFPGRIIPGGAVTPEDPAAAAREIARLAAIGIGGIGELMPDGQGFDPADEGVVRPLLEAIDAIDGFVVLHASEPVGHQYPGKGTVTPPVLERFLGIVAAAAPVRPRVVLAHWGGGLPFYALMPEFERLLDRVWFDTAASPFLYRDAVFQTAVAAAGAGRILYGTDYPLIGMRRFRERIAGLPLADADRAAILGGNAARVFRLRVPAEGDGYDHA